MTAMSKGIIRNLYDRVFAARPDRNFQKKDADAETRAKLRNLAEACGKGDADAMLKLSDFLRSIVPEDTGTANMWLLRAAIYGNAAAQDRVRDEMGNTPYFLKTSLIPYENFLPGRRADWHSGSYPGLRLNAAGLLAFQPEGSYMLAGINQYRTMQIWREADYDPADEDGFGVETYYDMFYLDEFFQPISGVPVVESVSTRDIEYLNGAKAKYEAMTRAMEEAVAGRKQVPLWTEFAEV